MTEGERFRAVRAQIKRVRESVVIPEAFTALYHRPIVSLMSVNPHDGQAAYNIDAASRVTGHRLCGNYIWYPDGYGGHGDFESELRGRLIRFMSMAVSRRQVRIPEGADYARAI